MQTIKVSRNDYFRTLADDGIVWGGNASLNDYVPQLGEAYDLCWNATLGGFRDFREACAHLAFGVLGR